VKTANTGGRIRIIPTEGRESKLCVVYMGNSGLQTPVDLGIENGHGSLLDGETGFFLCRSF